jgi:hypothetical protein
MCSKNDFNVSWCAEGNLRISLPQTNQVKTRKKRKKTERGTKKIRRKGKYIRLSIFKMQRREER